jgi:hypothetical protein
MYENATLKQQKRFDKAMVDTYIIGLLNDAVNPDLERICTAI